MATRIAPREERRSRGFERTASLVAPQVRVAGESRGFAVSRLLTHWAEIVGAEVASMARPVEISYGRGFGATLSLLTTGANAPILEMQKDRIREKANACYGYAAISRIRITQTAPTGFAEGQVAFDHAKAEASPRSPDPDPETARTARDAAAPVADPGLRDALETLGGHVLSAAKHPQKG